MKDSVIKSRIFICTSLMLAFMFVHVVTVIQACEQQVINTPTAISAFNG